MLYRISLMKNNLFDDNGLSFKWIVFMAQVLHFYYAAEFGHKKAEHILEMAQSWMSVT